MCFYEFYLCETTKILRITCVNLSNRKLIIIVVYIKTCVIRTKICISIFLPTQKICSTSLKKKKLKKLRNIKYMNLVYTSARLIFYSVSGYILDDPISTEQSSLDLSYRRYTYISYRQYVLGLTRVIKL